MGQITALTGQYGAEVHQYLLVLGLLFQANVEPAKLSVMASTDANRFLCGKEGTMIAELCPVFLKTPLKLIPALACRKYRGNLCSGTGS